MIFVCTELFQPRDLSHGIQRQVLVSGMWACYGLQVISAMARSWQLSCLGASRATLALKETQTKGTEASCPKMQQAMAQGQVQPRARPDPKINDGMPPIPSYRSLYLFPYTSRSSNESQNQHPALHHTKMSFSCDGSLCYGGGGGI